MAADSESGSESLGVGSPDVSSLGPGSPGPGSNAILFPRHEQTFPALTLQEIEPLAVT